MYDLNPLQVFVHKRVYEDEKATIRLEKMLKGLGNPPFEEVDVRDTDEVIEAAGMTEDLQVQSGRIRQGIMKNTTDPIMLLNTFVWDADKIAPIEKKYNNPKARSIARHMAGTGKGYIYGKREIQDGSDRPYVCQGGWAIHSLEGCVHKCDYCFCCCGQFSVPKRKSA